MAVPRTSGSPPARRAVVTGAASMIGRACVQAFVRDGADVLCVDHRSDELSAADLPSSHRLCVEPWSDAGAADVHDWCKREWDGVDVLVSCAGVIDAHGATDVQREEWEAIVTHNLTGPVFLAKALHPLMSRGSDCSIVFIGSIDGLHGNPRFPAFSASNAGLVIATHMLASAWADRARVNCVATGLIPHQATSKPEDLLVGVTALIEATPLGRPPAATEVASVVSFLSSSEASYVTGAVLPVDGGRLGMTPGTHVPRGA